LSSARIIFQGDFASRRVLNPSVKLDGAIPPITCVIAQSDNTFGGLADFLFGKHHQQNVFTSREI
jgi:hypothetical protein